MLEHVQADSDRYVQESLLQGLGMCLFLFLLLLVVRNGWM